MELGYDSLIFLLTIARTVYMHWKHQRSGPSRRTLMDKLIRDGAAYFAYVPCFACYLRTVELELEGLSSHATSAIFSMNLSWVIMIMYAPTGLRAIASV